MTKFCMAWGRSPLYNLLCGHVGFQPNRFQRTHQQALFSTRPLLAFSKINNDDCLKESRSTMRKCKTARHLKQHTDSQVTAPSTTLRHAPPPPVLMPWTANCTLRTSNVRMFTSASTPVWLKFGTRTIRHLFGRPSSSSSSASSCPSSDTSLVAKAGWFPTT